MPAALRSISNNSYGDFIKRFTKRESKKRKTKKRPKELTAVQRTSLRRQLKYIRFLNQHTRTTLRLTLPESYKSGRSM